MGILSGLEKKQKKTNDDNNNNDDDDGADYNDSNIDDGEETMMERFLR